MPTPTSSAPIASTDGDPLIQPRMPLRTPVIGLERERRRVPEPSLDRVGKFVVQRRGDVQKRGGAGSAVQILVAASHREVDPITLQLDLDCAGGVRQIPQRQGAGPMRRLRERRHVVPLAVAEVDVREREQRGVAVECLRDVRAVDRAQLATEQLDGAPRDVQIRREVAPLGDDHATLGTRPEHGNDELEQVHGGALGDEDLARCRADELGDPVTDTHRRFHPPVLRPRPHEDASPLVFRHALQPLDAGLGQPSHRVAVQVHGRIVDEKPVAESRQWVGRIERGARVSVEYVRKLDGHSRLRTSHSSGKKRSGIVVSR